MLSAYLHWMKEKKVGFTLQWDHQQQYFSGMVEGIDFPKINSENPYEIMMLTFRTLKGRVLHIKREFGTEAIRIPDLFEASDADHLRTSAKRINSSKVADDTQGDPNKATVH